MITAYAPRHLLEPTLGAGGSSRSASCSNVIVFFVFAEVAPKTCAVQHTERAALRTSGFLRFVTDFPPIRVIVARASSGFANVVLPGQGPARRARSSPRRRSVTMADVAAEEAAIETERARADPLDLRVRRHGRARGDAAAARHGRGRGRRDRRRGDRARRSARASRACPRSTTAPTTSSGSCS